MCPSYKKNPDTVRHLLEECPTWLEKTQYLPEETGGLSLENIIIQISSTKKMILLSKILPNDHGIKEKWGTKLY